MTDIMDESTPLKYLQQAVSWKVMFNKELRQRRRKKRLPITSKHPRNAYAVGISQSKSQPKMTAKYDTLRQLIDNRRRTKPQIIDTERDLDLSQEELNAITRKKSLEQLIQSNAKKFPGSQSSRLLKFRPIEPSVSVIQKRDYLRRKIQDESQNTSRSRLKGTKKLNTSKTRNSLTPEKGGSSSFRSVARSSFLKQRRTVKDVNLTITIKV